MIDKLLLIGLITSLQSAAAGELYKCSINGHVTYQQAPCQGTEAQIVLKTAPNPTGSVSCEKDEATKGLQSLRSAEMSIATLDIIKDAPVTNVASLIDSLNGQREKLSSLQVPVCLAAAKSALLGYVIDLIGVRPLPFTPSIDFLPAAEREAMEPLL